jgi:HK97 gp10 family phage protein
MAFGSFSQQFSDEVHRRITDEMQQRAKVVVSIAERYAPKQTGRLATSIGFTYDDASMTVTFIVGAPYGLFVEYGTRHMAPQPYLRPAINTYFEAYGFNTAMEFQNVIPTDRKLLARGAGFEAHRSLTPRQIEHIKTKLKSASERHHIGQVGRSKLIVRVNHDHVIVRHKRY